MFPREPATYIMTHRPSGVYYIGSTGNLNLRVAQHKYKIINGEHNSTQFKALSSRWEDISIEYELAVDYHNAESLEIALLKTNIKDPLCSNAMTTVQEWAKATTHFDEARRKSADTRRGKPRDELTRSKISAAKSRRIVGDGVEYASALEASQKLGIPYRTVRSRLGSNNGLGKLWYYL